MFYTLGVCPAGGYTPDNQFTCYVLATQSATWDAFEWGGPCSSLMQNAAYSSSRVAVFLDSGLYKTVMQAVVPAGSTIWIGAQGSLPGTALSDYNWMTTHGIPGSAVTSTSTTVSVDSGIGSLPCLYINAQNIYDFHAGDCAAGSGHQAVCELSE